MSNTRTHLVAFADQLAVSEEMNARRWISLGGDHHHHLLSDNRVTVAESTGEARSNALRESGSGRIHALDHLKSRTSVSVPRRAADRRSDLSYSSASLRGLTVEFTVGRGNIAAPVQMP